MRFDKCFHQKVLTKSTHAGAVERAGWHLMVQRHLALVEPSSQPNGAKLAAMEATVVKGAVAVQEMCVCVCMCVLGAFVQVFLHMCESAVDYSLTTGIIVYLL